MVICALAMVAACANAADIDSASADTHVLRARVVGGATPIEVLKDAVVKQAKAFCEKQQRVVKVRTSDASPSADRTGTEVRVTFSCLAADDPELRKN